MRSVLRPRRLAALLAAGVLVLGACGYDDTVVPSAEEEATAGGGGSGPSPVECDNPTQSYAPSDDRAAARAQLVNPGQLVVGVSADTLKLGSADPEDGFAIKGFDIDVAQAVADALGVTLRLRVISAAERIDLLGGDADGDGEAPEPQIDLVVRNMTMNCTRWSQIGFSAVYYNATQKVLVREDDVPAFEKDGLESLDGKRVCAPAGSTSIDNITEKQPDAVPVAAANHTGCLVKFQQGEVDAITGDDTVLAGLAAQDPYAVVPDQEKLTDEPYGVGANKDDVALIRFVNSVLEQRRSNGEWQRSYDRWLKPYLGDARPPAPSYGR
ncbi:glutamate ABC transporter substrate-binding protein [Nocardioides sp. J54]|uniref:glutamate ABC transporter substrate-binding protein n=1 Tax=Nocardioides sp. J54 TaxID=935866 RepID=UPI0004B9A540|nr:glutamate ABC transporter substrate-binding protein [Nocardioides sp. J54]